jgi:hypothetical protein
MALPHDYRDTETPLWPAIHDQMTFLPHYCRPVGESCAPTQRSAVSAPHAQGQSEPSDPGSQAPPDTLVKIA